MSLYYDPTGRLRSTTLGGTTTDYVHSGDKLIGEYDTAGNPIQLYVYAPNSDIPIARFSGTDGLNDLQYLRTDERGSIVSVTDALGEFEGHQYDVYGVPQNQSNSLFRYTGQIQLRGTDLYHYKARAYHPGLGRFLQTDPIGYDDGMNMYTYVGNDPVNGVDPNGMAACPNNDSNCIDDPATERGTEEQPPPTEAQRAIEEVVVTARKQRKFSDGSKIKLHRLPEQAFTANEDGVHPINAYQRIRQSCSDGSQREGLSLNLAAFGGNAGGHTHPDRGTGLSGLPGPEDGRLARALGGSNYVISGRGAFAIDSTAVGFRVRQLTGRNLSRSERRSVQGIVSRYNQHGGGSGVSCTTTVID